MKRILSILLASIILSTSTGCFGEFALVRKVYNWNENVADSKFVQTLLFYAMNIVPVYGVAGFIDFWILNLVEFWTGSNPISMEEGDFERQIIPLEGEDYIVEATKNQFKIYKEGEECDASYIYFNENDNSWSLMSNGYDQKLIALEVNEAGTFYRVYNDETSYLVDATEENSNELTASANYTLMPKF